MASIKTLYYKWLSWKKWSFFSSLHYIQAELCELIGLLLVLTVTQQCMSLSTHQAVVCQTSISKAPTHGSIVSITNHQCLIINQGILFPDLYTPEPIEMVVSNRWGRRMCRSSIGRHWDSVRTHWWPAIQGQAKLITTILIFELR